MAHATLGGHISNSWAHVSHVSQEEGESQCYAVRGLGRCNYLAYDEEWSISRCFVLWLTRARNDISDNASSAYNMNAMSQWRGRRTDATRGRHGQWHGQTDTHTPTRRVTDRPRMYAWSRYSTALGLQQLGSPPTGRKQDLSCCRDGGAVLVCDFLLVNNTNIRGQPVPHRIQVIAW